MEAPGGTKVALVTGAASGLGRATTAAFADAGYRIAGVDLEARDISLNGDSCAYSCDVSDADSVEQTVSEIEERFGAIHVAVNCAGIDFTYWIDELTIEQFDRVLAVNLRGPFLIAKAVWPVMRRLGGGHIVNIASTAAVRAWSGASAYHASKFGVLGLSRGLGAEGRRDGIKVTTVIPGGMQTGFFDRFAEQGIPPPDPEMLQDPRDVARTIVYTVGLPEGTAIQELIITPLNEPSWP